MVLKIVYLYNMNILQRNTDKQQQQQKHQKQS